MAKKHEFRFIFYIFSELMLFDLYRENTMTLDTNSAKTLDRNFKKIVTSKSQAFSATIRKNKIVLSGNKTLVNLIEENHDITVKELCQKMMLETEISDEYETSSPFMIFPKLLTKFKGKNWTYETAREQLLIILNLYSFGNGGSRKYKNF